MDYGSYTDASVRLMVELANSYDPRQDPPEQLPDIAAVTGFLRRHRMLGPNTVRARRNRTAPAARPHPPGIRGQR